MMYSLTTTMCSLTTTMESLNGGLYLIMMRSGMSLKRGVCTYATRGNAPIKYRVIINYSHGHIDNN